MNLCEKGGMSTSGGVSSFLIWLASLSVFLFVDDEVRAPEERVRVKEEDGELHAALGQCHEECLLLRNFSGFRGPLREFLQFSFFSAKARHDFDGSQCFLGNTSHLFRHVQLVEGALFHLSSEATENTEKEGKVCQTDQGEDRSIPKGVADSR